MGAKGRGRWIAKPARNLLRGDFEARSRSYEGERRGSLGREWVLEGNFCNVLFFILQC